MLIIKKADDLVKYLSLKRKERKKIGFVPTMGALHEGHVSLINASKNNRDFTVCSIFVNPTQFNDKEDLIKYPRTVENDIEILVAAHCDVLFLPSVEEIYPDNMDVDVDIDLGKLDKVLEGKHRPGHFKGMMNVVKRLLDIVQPDFLYMGQKDFQQFTIIQNMIDKLNLNVKLMVCPIIREDDGLAMSSRNVLLPEHHRKLVPLIYKTLLQAKEDAKNYTPEEVKQKALRKLDIPEFDVEYFEIVGGKTLEPFDFFRNITYAVALTAVKIGKVRLIDNTILKTTN